INAASFASRVSFGTANGTYNLATKDLDGDGKPDVVTANQATDSISVLKNTTSNNVISFATRVDFTAGNSPRKVAVADLNEDGKPEILVVNSSSSTLSIFQNQITNGVINSNSFGSGVD